MALSITDRCVNCYTCQDVCPSDAITQGSTEFDIDARACTECTGHYADPQCASICPVEPALLDGQGSDHLWEDLGVWNRTSLSTLLQQNIPTLAAKNSRDMKWKKFLFKQLCETKEIYICRAPSGDECADFNDCFGAED
tara:strand:+ start:220 stop:636 length:417 start_codon:yes stop_codon:yes gene_type:complete